MVPDLLISLIPFMNGLVMLLFDFKLFVLIGMLIFAQLTTLGNAAIRGSYACKYCKQAEPGCPANK
jgi:hypothetical protein